jgi:hypothetical protein
MVHIFCLFGLEKHHLKLVSYNLLNIVIFSASEMLYHVIGEAWRMQSIMASQQGSGKKDESENTWYLGNVSYILLLNSSHYNAKTFQQGEFHIL